METTTWMIQTIHLPSRWDIFKVPIDQLPEGQFQVKGADGSWLLTTKAETILWHKLEEQMYQIEVEHMLGIKPIKRNEQTTDNQTNESSTAS